ncbi:MAG: bifunctional hydroxymethylpyrimidine kinase/phosphomethylpyrimidine kinase [Pseudomonadota bacterium]
MLAIAGSDPSGGAGLQADLKVCADHGVFGCAAVTALTVQGPRGVRAVHPVAPEVVHDQVIAVLEEVPVAAIKIGMLGEAAVVRAVARALARRAPGVPVVLDPVLRATRGAALLEAEGLVALLEALLPEVTLLTPNLPEHARLDVAAGGLARRCSDLGVAVLRKGGHGEGDLLVDRLIMPDGQTHTFSHPRLATPATHGTGCALSSAIAARLARGEGLEVAVEGAIGWLQGVLAAGREWGLAPAMPLGLVRR